MVPQTPELNRGIWAGIETAVRDLAVREGEVYVVTGPAFQGGQLRSIGPDGVLVPSATWKAVCSLQDAGTVAYLCSNTARPRCGVVSIAQLSGMTGVDPFPALSAGIKQTAMSLPSPEDGYRGRQERRYRTRRHSSPL